MKKIIVRNIAIITAIFMMTLSIMLITNYFQVKEISPLQTQVVETLKQINDLNANNPQLQEQIRQLDLMARKAYFLNMDHLMRGVYLLLSMLVVFIICIQMYFAQHKNIPDKEIDPIDEWAIKTQARKYVGILATTLAAVALLFVVFSLPFMQVSQNNTTSGKDESLVQNISSQTDAEHIPVAPTPEVNEAIVSAKTTETTNQKEISEKTAPHENTEQPGSSVAETAIKTEKDTPETAEETTKNAALAQETETTDEEIEPAEKVSVPKINSNAFRGNHSNGITQAKNIPVKWNLQKGSNIAWKTEIPRHGQSSPVINGNRVFITGADEQARELYCYHLNTGKLLWHLSAANIPGSPNQVPKTTPDTGLASSSVATNGTQVCAIFATGDLICANMDGKKLWAKNLGVPDNHYGYASSLLIFNNHLFIQYDNRNIHKIIALNTKNGHEVWSKDRPEKITWSSPSIAYINNTPQLVLMGNPAITAYHVNNGEQLWRVECLTGEVGASACSSNGIIFGASEYARLVAISGTDGSILWESMDYLPEASSPVATANNLYLATSYGVVASYDTKTGTLRKEHETNGEFYSSPMLADGKIYLFSNDGTLYIFSADDAFTLLNSFETGEKTFATPAFTNGRIVVRTEKSIYCVKENEHEQL